MPNQQRKPNTTPVQRPGRTITGAIIVGLVAAALTGAAPAQASPKPGASCLGRLYAVNSYSDSVSVINTNSNKVISTIAVGKSPAFDVFTPDGKQLYVVNNGDASISLIDVATNSVVRTIHTDPLPIGLAFTPDGKKLVISYITGSVRVVDVATDQAGPSIKVGLDPEQIRITPDGRFVYLASTLAGLYKVDIARNRVVATIPTKDFHAGALPFPYNLLISPDGNTVYVANTFGGFIAVVDTRSDAVVREWSAPGAVGLQLSADRQRLYVSNFWGASIDEYRIATGALVKSTGKTVITLPSHLAESADGKTVYFGQSFNTKLQAVNASTLKPVKTLTVGVGPNSLAICKSASPR